MSLLLNCRSISKSYATRMLFSGVSISIAEGERVGLIGPNGGGKSTLVKILAGLESADGGEVTTRRALRLGYLPQEDVFPPDSTTGGVLVDALRVDVMEDHQREARAAILLGKLGFDGPDQNVSELSGGWHQRLAIARQLIREPELLLLDEPTNHLDLEGILWLEKLLANAPFAFLMISHDRYFLENAVNRIVELDRSYPEGSFSIDGNYSYFLEKRESFLASEASRQEAMSSRVRRELEWLKRGAKARTCKAKGRADAAQNMVAELAEMRTRLAASRTAAIDLVGTDRKTRKLVVGRNLSKTINGRSLFRDLDLILSPGTTVGLLGPNGSGKTTLLRMLAGELPPDSGEVRHADGLRVVSFQQDRAVLDRAQTLRRALSPTGDTVFYRDRSIHIASWARQFLFGPEQLDIPVGQLSGGEQARVLLARLMLQPADLLLLDEPTSDLDIPTLEVLEESLEDFPGAIVLVTHDRYLLDRLCTDLLGLDGRGGAGLYADLFQYEKALRQAAEPAVEKKSSPKPATPATPKPPSRRLTYMEQREWEQMEANILQAEATAETLRERMEDPLILADHAKLNACCQQLSEAQHLVARLYERWAELERKQTGS